MTRQRNTTSRRNYYIQTPKPYYVKKRPGKILLQFAVLFVVLITLTTGATIHTDIDYQADVYPDTRVLGALVPQEAEDENAWTKNLIPPIDNAIYMAWDYDPLSISQIPPGVNVLAPTWFYAEADPVTDKAIVKSLLQMGKPDWNPQQYVEFCHANGVKVWGTFVCIGQPNLAQQIVTDMDVQNDIIARLVAWTKAYNLDGISLDFEKMKPEYNEQFTQFAKNIKDALPVGQNIVSAAVTVKLLGDTSGNLWQSYDRAGLAEAIDYIAVMTYESHGNELIPNASIDWVDTHIRRLLEEVPSNKLIMGVPFYGVDFIARVIDSDSFDVELLWKDDPDYRVNFFSSTLQSALANGSYTKSSKTVTVDYWLDKGSWSDEFGIAQYVFVDTTGLMHTIYIDDESSLYQKGALAMRYALAGVGIWREGFGYDAMWEALADGLS